MSNRFSLDASSKTLSAVSEWIVWWIDELMLMRRALAERLGFTSKRSPTFEIEAGQLRLVGGVDRSKSGTRIDGTLRVPTSYFLVRNTAFPTAAKSVLLQAVKRFAESVCPFDPADMRYGWVVNAGSDKSDEIEITVGIISASRVEFLMVEAERYNISATKLECVTDVGEIEVDLLTPPQRVQRLFFSRAFRWVLMVVFLIATGFVLERIRTLQRVDQLETFIESKRDDLEIKRALRAEEKLKEDGIAARNVFFSRASMAELVVEISELLPDTAYLTALQISKTEMMLDGAADDAVALVPLFEGSLFVESATFETEIRSMRLEGKQGFRLKLERSDQ